MAIARRGPFAGDSGDGGGPGHRCHVGDAFPDLWEFITLAKWPDGTERELGTFMVLWEGGMFKVWLNDKHAGLSCWVSGDTLEAALGVADKACAGSGGDWRKPRPQGGRRR